MTLYRGPMNFPARLTPQPQLIARRDRPKRIEQYLFEQDRHDEHEMIVYAVLDGANCPLLLDHLYSLKPPFACLYSGELTPDMAECAPYVVQIEEKTPFTRWLLDEGWGKSWGIFVSSTVDLRAIRRHLRTFLMVYDPEGNPIYFRYYDPRVMRIYLPTCNTEETRLVFGPITHFLMEDEEPVVLLRFRAAGATPHQESLILQEGL